ncbi:DUF2637 domain-containing protein [Streptomyces sp. NPDC058595]|uniref:DUF2637 domain-containing protein n=1 Tax=Streptomyces sp. NPDC058595 TaxID=3346550 RepID=UPI00366118A7
MEEELYVIAGKTTTAAVKLTRTHRILIGVVVAGAVLIAAIGFAGSYSAVRDLAEKKGFGQFSIVFPIGIDAGICVLLALDLLLTWMRIPFPLLRQTAWLLTAATIAFNGAAAWPDPLGVGMHAVIPILFVVSVEAARHAVGRIADITADKHMEGVRLTRWLLSPVPTFKLWRRMKLWEIRSYEDIIQLEQDRLIYQARLQARYGRNWRRKAPIEAMMPLRLAKYGVPLADTGPAGLAAAGIEPASVSVVRADVPSEESSRSLPATEPGPYAIDAAEPERRAEPSAPDSVPVTPEPEFDPEPVTYQDAYRAYAAEYGVFPDVKQFDEFLTRSYGVHVDERDLAAIVDELVQDELVQAEADGDVADDREVADGESGRSAPEMTAPAAAPADYPHRSAQSQSVPERPATERVPAATGAAGGRMAAGGLPHQMAAGTNGGAAGGSSVAAGPTVWEASATGHGTAATALLPEQRDDEPDPDPRQQEILQVVAWIEEEEAAGTELKGAEVARRLGIPTRTGQRRLNSAAELRAQLREMNRVPLRSVPSGG